MAASYRVIKDHVRRQIARGRWTPGTRIPSENELVREFGAARMTVNRALRELASDGMLTRSQGRGTFVAELSLASSFLQVRDIHEEIAARGHRHHLARHVLRAERASADIASQLDLAPGARVFHVIVVHHENDIPVQVEERWINPEVAPEFLSIRLESETPGRYLTRVAPLTEAEHIIEARMPGATVRKLLDLKRGEPCLQVRRRTWVRRKVAAYGVLSHPGSVYRLEGRFKP
jgi:GntR family histidine utilization transcriptional repressor